MENKKEIVDIIFNSAKNVLDVKKIEYTKSIVIQSALKRCEQVDIIVSNSYLTLKIIVDDKNDVIVNNKELIDLYLFLEKIFGAKND